MTRARDNSFNPFNNQVAGKNIVINGAFDFWQRGTSISGSAASYLYSADRWQMSATTISTITRQTTNDTTNLPHIQYAARVQRTNGTTSTARHTLITNIESVNSIPFAGKTITFSFYARRGSNYSGTSNVLGTGFYTGTGTDQNILNGFTNLSPTFGAFTLTTSWQRFTQTINIGSNVTQIAIQFYYDPPAGTAGADDWFEITGVQAELGSSATQFSRAGGTIGGELLLCQRYYNRPQTAAGFLNLTCNYLAAYTNSYSQSVNFPVAMRATPSLTVADIASTANRITGYLSAGNVNNLVPTIQPSVSGFRIFTSGEYRYFEMLNVEASAEL